MTFDEATKQANALSKQCKQYYTAVRENGQWTVSRRFNPSYIARKKEWEEYLAFKDQEWQEYQTTIDLQA